MKPENKNLDAIVASLVDNGQLAIANIIKKFIETVETPNADQLDAAQKLVADLLKACNSSNIWQFYKPKDLKRIPNTYFSATLPNSDESKISELEVSYALGSKSRNVFITLTDKGNAVMHTITRKE